MKITDSGPADINADRLSRTNNPAATTEHKPRQTEQSGQSDNATRVSISAARRQHAEAVTQSLQTQRAETVRAIREQIEDGVYRVDAKDVARAILQKGGAYVLRTHNQQDQ